MGKASFKGGASLDMLAVLPYVKPHSRWVATALKPTTSCAPSTIPDDRGASHLSGRRERGAHHAQPPGGAQRARHRSGRTARAAGTIGEEFYRPWIRGLNRLEDMPKVTLAVLHGHSIGGGLQLGLACDLRLATEDAVLGLGASRHGIIPDGGVLRLARLVGLGRAKELALLNDEISPAEARAIGLINWVCAAADVDRTLASIIDKARGAAPTATAHTKRL